MQLLERTGSEAAFQCLPPPSFLQEVPIFSIIAADDPFPRSPTHPSTVPTTTTTASHPTTTPSTYERRQHTHFNSPHRRSSRTHVHPWQKTARKRKACAEKSSSGRYSGTTAAHLVGRLNLARAHVSRGWRIQRLERSRARRRRWTGATTRCSPWLCPTQAALIRIGLIDAESILASINPVLQQTQAAPTRPINWWEGDGDSDWEADVDVFAGFGSVRVVPDGTGVEQAEQVEDEFARGEGEYGGEDEEMAAHAGGGPIVPGGTGAELVGEVEAEFLARFGGAHITPIEKGAVSTVDQTEEEDCAHREGERAKARISGGRAVRENLDRTDETLEPAADAAHDLAFRRLSLGGWDFKRDDPRLVTTHATPPPVPPNNADVTRPAGAGPPRAQYPRGQGFTSVVPMLHEPRQPHVRAALGGKRPPRQSRLRTMRTVDDLARGARKRRKPRHSVNIILSWSCFAIGVDEDFES